MSHVSELAVNVSVSIPSQEDMLLAAKHVEDEMAGMPLNSKNAFDYVNRIQEEMAKMIVVSVSDAERHPKLAGITSGK